MHWSKWYNFIFICICLHLKSVKGFRIRSFGRLFHKIINGFMTIVGIEQSQRVSFLLKGLIRQQSMKCLPCLPLNMICLHWYIFKNTLEHSQSHMCYMAIIDITSTVYSIQYKTMLICQIDVIKTIVTSQYKYSAMQSKLRSYFTPWLIVAQKLLTRLSSNYDLS